MRREVTTLSDPQVQYRIVVHRESDHYWAEVLELPGCFATGFTWEELWEALAEGIGMYLSTDERRYEAIFNTLPPEPSKPTYRRRHERYVEKQSVSLCPA